jgi:predicted ArsR family transcriptional regulator
LSPQRARVLEQLERAAGPVTVEHTASSLHVHSNTARKNLEALVDRGLATRERAAASGRGRPAWTYSAAEEQPEPDPRVSDYAGLATALAGQIARSSADPEADALAAGEAWGRSLVDGQAVGTAASARRRVVALFAELGFDPRADPRAMTLRLLRCPLLDAARANPGVVCAVHLGIARGALTALGGIAEGSSLHAFAQPGACVLTFGLGSQASRSATERASQP